MIVDSVKSFERYLSLNERFKEVYAFMRQPNFAELPVGKHVIKENEIWCNISENQCRALEDAPLEVHDSFIDVQVVLQGSEIYGWKDRSLCDTSDTKYDDKNDIAFLHDTPDAFLTVEPMQAVIFFPQDAHAPLIGQGTIKKAVFKVLYK